MKNRVTLQFDDETYAAIKLMAKVNRIPASKVLMRPLEKPLEAYKEIAATYGSSIGFEARQLRSLGLSTDHLPDIRDFIAPPGSSASPRDRRKGERA